MSEKELKMEKRAEQLIAALEWKVNYFFHEGLLDIVEDPEANKLNKELNDLWDLYESLAE